MSTWYSLMTPSWPSRRPSTLVNSAVEPDTLTTVAELDAWYAEHAYTGRHDRRDAPSWTPYARCGRVLRELLTADRDDAAELVNAMLAEAGALPRLVRHDGLRLAPARGVRRRAAGPAGSPSRRRWRWST